MSKTKKTSIGKYLILLLIMVLFVLLVQLGFWQLARAEQKQDLLKQWNQPATNFNSNTGIESDYRKVQLTGTLNTTLYFLLDNRTRNGQVGYEVITSLNIQQGNKSILVNLGWIKAGNDRNILPILSIPRIELKLQGWLKKVEPVFQLADTAWSEGWPKRIQGLELIKLRQVLDKESLVDNILLVEHPLLEHTVTDWQPVNMLPQRHLGYAVQWFALALALALLLIWFYITERRAYLEIVNAKY